MNSPLPARLRSARKAANLTQQELGIRIGMDPNTASARINQYEKDRHSPGIQTAKRLAEELGVPLPYLFCEDDLLAELICKIDRMSQADKKALLKILADQYAEG